MMVIIDYGMGNLGSIHNMLRRLGTEAIVTSDHAAIQSARKLILPGVGAFDHGMENLARLGLIPVLNEAVLAKKTPVLGICLGMQLLSRRSEEGQLPGLGWIDAQTVRFRFPENSARLKIPHMGWNFISPRTTHPLLEGLDNPRFYFVHSYHVCCDCPEHVLATCRHGIEFTAAVCKDNILGTQFHPEKSHRFGMALLKNFATRL
jgi:glutamine amidotransferase